MIMADAPVRSSGDRRQQSRLQRRAPASIQVSPVTDWNVAIPLLSPLVMSPSSPAAESQTKNKEEESKRDPPPRVKLKEVAAEKPPVAYKKWQHPAAPFCYEPAPMMPFVFAGAVDPRRS